MGEPALDLSQEQLNSIGNFVQLHLHEWIDDRIINQRERIIRVEESLTMKMRQDTKDRFERVDKQFAWVYTFLSATFITILGGIVTLIVRSV